MIWAKDRNEDREDHDVDIFNIIQKVQDTVIHLEEDEKQWKITHIITILLSQCVLSSHLF